VQDSLQVGERNATICGLAAVAVFLSPAIHRPRPRPFAPVADRKSRAYSRQNQTVLCVCSSARLLKVTALSTPRERENDVPLRARPSERSVRRPRALPQPWPARLRVSGRGARARKAAGPPSASTRGRGARASTNNSRPAAKQSAAGPPSASTSGRGARARCPHRVHEAAWRPRLVVAGRGVWGVLVRAKICR